MWPEEGGTNRSEDEGTQTILDVFYTEVPKSIGAPDLDELSEDVYKAAYSKEKWSVGPQRIRMHSEEMLQELRQTTKVLQRGNMLMMIPPFKLFIHNRHGIESKLKELKQQAIADCNSERSPSPPVEETKSVYSGSGRSSSGTSDEEIREYSRIDRLQCIHNLIQTDLVNYVGLDVRARSGELDEVLFEEVYYLFKPGDLIISAEHGDAQLYQVYSVTGGRMRLSTPNTPDYPRYNSRRLARLGATTGTWTDLKINSFIMAWDGEDIGPLQVNHAISYFAGERKVTDLDVYPIQFHKCGRELRRQLRARGQKVIECFGHKQYAGVSVRDPGPLAKFGMGEGRLNDSDSDSSSDSSDEGEDGKLASFDMVRGDVYVDYKPSYGRSFHTNPSLSKLGRTSSEETEVVEILDDGKELTHGDQEVDIHLSDKFLSSHRHLTKIGKPQKNPALDNDRLQLLSGHIPAFIFSTRKWSMCKTSS